MACVSEGSDSYGGQWYPTLRLVDSRQGTRGETFWRYREHPQVNQARFQGDLMYLSSFTGEAAELKVFDFGDPSHPALLGKRLLIGPGLDIAVRRNILAVADGWAGYSLVDVSQPTDMPFLSYQTGGTPIPDQVALGGHRMAVTGKGVFDITDPVHPRPLASTPPGLSLGDILAYQFLPGGGLAVVLHSDPGPSMRVIDLDAPGGPAYVGPSLLIPKPGAAITETALRGGYLFVGTHRYVPAPDPALYFSVNVYDVLSSPSLALPVQFDMTYPHDQPRFAFSGDQLLVANDGLYSFQLDYTCEGGLETLLGEQEPSASRDWNIDAVVDAADMVREVMGVPGVVLASGGD